MVNAWLIKGVMQGATREGDAKSSFGDSKSSFGDSKSSLVMLALVW
jgi:hypothetical protein